MANEIIGTGSLQANGRTEVRMVYVFPVVPRVVDSLGAQVVPAFDINRMPVDLRSKLTAAQVTAITNGDAGFHVTTIAKSAGETDAAFAARIRIDYDALSAYYLQQRRDEAIEAAEYDLRRFAINR